MKYFFRRVVFTYFYFLILFAIHRLLIYPLLSDNLDAHTLSTIQSALVGLASDAWIACLFAFAFATLFALFSSFLPSDKINRVFLGLIIVLGILLSAHLNYVEFFRQQFSFQHLEYLFDLEFLKANSKSALSISSLALGSLALILGIAYRKSPSFDRQTLLKQVLILFALLGVNTGLHVFNLIYRWRWFVPDHLRANVVENFYQTYLLQIPRKSLSEEELNILVYNQKKSVTGQNTILSHEKTLDDFLQSSQIELDPMGQKIAQTFFEQVETKKNPLIIIILIESLRYYDTGPNPSGNTLTPSLDKLKSRAISFSHFYATGKVTRGAQEAVFCSHLGNESVSLMRTPAIQSFPPCLPQIISHVGGVSHWLHGGEARFDSQEKFWHNQNINFTLSKSDFPPKTPSTGWGISDVYFFNQVAEQLMTLAAKPSSFSLNLLLSVSNHIPWDLPEDAPQKIKLKKYEHPSFATVELSDFALGEFFQKLQNNELWGRSLIFVTGDHGTIIDPWLKDLAHGYQGEVRNMELLSRVPLFLTGGIIDQSLKSLNLSHLEVDDFLSQGGIFSFVAKLTQVNAPIKATSLFSRRPKIPVISQFADKLYLPESNTIIDFKNLEQSQDEASLFVRYFNNKLLHQ